MSHGMVGTGTVSTLIVDDEQLARDELAFLLKDFPEIEILDFASNGPAAVKLIEQTEPELVFLDVQMPGLDGLGVISAVTNKLEQVPHFVLTTAYDQYALEAFRLDALDYLLKPVEKERLAETIARAKRIVEEKSSAQEKGGGADSKPALQRSKLLV